MATPTNPGQLTYSQLEQLWINNGGPPGAAPEMAAIALAESGGWTNAVAGAPPGSPASASTDANGGSYGPWMINGSHAGIKGPPPRDGGPTPSPGWIAEMMDPNQNAKEAIALYANGQGLTNWSTYNNKSYLQFLNGGNATSAQLAAYADAANASATLSPTAPGFYGLKDPSAPVYQMNLGLFSWTILTQGQWRFIKGGSVAVAGFIVMGLGVAVLLKSLGAGSGVVSAASKAPGFGWAAQALSNAGSKIQSKAS